MDGIYNNTGYRNTRNRKQILILDVFDDSLSDTHLGSATEFNIPLFEPLIIDKKSEVYLDNFVTFNSNISHISDNTAFVLKINEFNIASNVASSINNAHIYNSIIIPNEHNSVSGNNSAVLHKAKKFNYVCDINPGKISNITGKITNLTGNSMFHGENVLFTHTYILTGIDNTNYSGNDPNNSLPFPLLSTDKFVSLSNMREKVLNSDGSGVAIVSNTIKGGFLALHEDTTSVIYFSTNKELGGILDPAEDIVFQLGDRELINGAFQELRITIGSSNLHLHDAGHGRFIAEFSINSVE